MVGVPSGIEWFSVEFGTGTVFGAWPTAGVGEFIPGDRAENGESRLPLELCLSVWNQTHAGVGRGGSEEEET